MSPRGVERSNFAGNLAAAGQAVLDCGGWVADSARLLMGGSNDPAEIGLLLAGLIQRARREWDLDHGIRAAKV